MSRARTYWPSAAGSFARAESWPASSPAMASRISSVLSSSSPILPKVEGSAWTTVAVARNANSRIFIKSGLGGGWSVETVVENAVLIALDIVFDADAGVADEGFLRPERLPEGVVLVALEDLGGGVE